MNLLTYLLLLSSVITTYLFLRNRSKSSYKTSLSTTDDYYQSVTIDVGTPGQSLDILLDTTNLVTFVMTNNTKTLSSTQEYFSSSASSTWMSSTNTFTYTYENATTNGTKGFDILQVASINVTNLVIGLAEYNQQLFEKGKYFFLFSIFL